MTANDLLHKLQKEVCKLSTGDIPVLLDKKFIPDAKVELVKHNGEYFINITPDFMFDKNDSN